MMRTGTLTYHSGYNYGASLQAFALQTVLINKLGIDNEIINFEPKDFYESRRMLTKHPKRLKEVIKTLTRLMHHKSLSKREKLFDDFTKEQLVTTPLYRNRDEVIDASNKYDCLICGSDQIWNLGASGDEFAANKLYYLNFPKNEKRISYAASFGGWVKEAPKRSDEIRQWLSEFDSLSVREPAAKLFLEELGLSSEVDVDPTLLLDADDYRKISKDPGGLPEKYILLFSWNVDRDMVEVAKKASREFGSPIINIVPPPRVMFSGIDRRLDIGPREFLYLIDNAEFVVTGSFHGTVLSSLFEKDFISVYKEVPDVRMKSTLERLGLSHRLRDIEKIGREDFKNSNRDDYDQMQRRLQDLRKESLEYIRKELA